MKIALLVVMVGCGGWLFAQFIHQRQAVDDEYGIVTPEEADRIIKRAWRTTLDQPTVDRRPGPDR